MQRSTLVVLSIVVALLGTVFWWQSAREGSVARSLDTPLFEGFEFDSVNAVRIENRERDVHLRAVRDPDGRWNLVDPEAVPAASPLIDHLVRTALARRGTRVPDAEVDPRALDLDPPRVVLELEGTVAGAPATERVELGALDLDGQRVNVRVRGVVLRTLRDLDTTLGRPLEDFKSRALVGFDARDVIEVHRTGKFTPAAGGAERDLAFDALADDGAWRVTTPVQAALDPVAMHLWLEGTTRLEIERFVEDSAVAPSARGLDPAEVVIELVTLRNDRIKLHFGRPGHTNGMRWFARREGESLAFGISESAAPMLALPLEDLLDHRLTRLAPDAIDGLALHSNEHDLLLARTGRVWNVSEKRGPSGVFGVPVPAEPGKVADLLGRLDALEFAGFRFDRPFTPSVGGERISIESGAHAEGGILGARYTSDSGSVALEFQRPGESVVALVDPLLIDLVNTPIEELESLRLIEVLELEQSRLRITGFARELQYFRGARGLWMRPGLALEATELRAVLDPLLFVHAAKYRAPGTLVPLVDPIEIEFTSKGGAFTAYTIGLATGRAGEDAQVVEVEASGRRALIANKSAKLHADLKQLLTAPPR